jgi:hypothetical protein
MSQLVFDELGAAPLILGLLYLIAMLVASYKLHRLQQASKELTTEKLFCMTLLLACVTRFLGFVTLGNCFNKCRLHCSSFAAMRPHKYSR